MNKRPFLSNSSNSDLIAFNLPYDSKNVDNYSFIDYLFTRQTTRKTTESAN